MPMMPHMGSVFLFRLLLRPELGGPTWLVDLLLARDRQCVWRHVMGDDRAGRDDGAITHGDRGDQRGVRADEAAGADDRPGLGEAVIVARDGAGANVALRADCGIAEISEVVGLGARAQL